MTRTYQPKLNDDLVGSRWDGNCDVYSTHQSRVRCTAAVSHVPIVRQECATVSMLDTPTFVRGCCSVHCTSEHLFLSAHHPEPLHTAASHRHAGICEVIM